MCFYISAVNLRSKTKLLRKVTAQIWKHAHTHTHTHTHSHADTHPHPQTHVRKHTHAHARARAHTHTHIYRNQINTVEFADGVNMGIVSPLSLSSWLNYICVCFHISAVTLRIKIKLLRKVTAQKWKHAHTHTQTHSHTDTDQVTSECACISPIEIKPLLLAILWEVSPGRSLLDLIDGRCGMSGKHTYMKLLNRNMYSCYVRLFVTVYIRIEMIQNGWHKSVNILSRPGQNGQHFAADFHMHFWANICYFFIAVSFSQVLGFGESYIRDLVVTTTTIAVGKNLIITVHTDVLAFNSADRNVLFCSKFFCGNQQFCLCGLD